MIVNGWKLTGNRCWGGKGFEAIHTCGFISGFDSNPRFLNNKKHCKGCEWGHYSTEKGLVVYYGQYRYNASKKNIPFNLTMEDFAEIVKRPCKYCGDIQMVSIKKNMQPFSGVDRVDNTKGYSIDNIVPCCRICNVAKNNLTEKEFRAKVVAWYETMIR